MIHIKNDKKYQEIISYLFWGVMTTVINWGTYTLFSFLLGGINNKLLIVFLSNILSWIFATVFAFVTNKIFVFKANVMRAKIVLLEISKFVSTRLVTGTFEVVAVPMLVKIGLNHTIFGIRGMLSKVIVSFVVVIMNYFVSKRFIFKKGDYRENKADFNE